MRNNRSSRNRCNSRDGPRISRFFPFPQPEESSNNGSGSRKNPNSNMSNTKALNLLDQIINQNSQIKQLIEDNLLLDLLMFTGKFCKADQFQLLKCLNLFVEWNSGETSLLNSLFILISQSKFVDEGISKTIHQFMMKSPEPSEIEIILTFCINCLTVSPIRMFATIMPLYPIVLMSSEIFSDSKIQQMRTNCVKSFEYAKQAVESPQSSNQSSSNSVVYDNSYRQESVIPGQSDIFCLNEEVPLKENKVSSEKEVQNNKYDSVDDYLSTHFHLLKEDFIRPLRESIAKIRETLLYSSNLSGKDLQVRVYDKVLIEDLLPSRNGIVYKVKFDISKFTEKMDWEKSRRFIHGSLLCFTNNYFKTMYFASVSESDPKTLKKGFLMVQFDEDPISEILANNEFLMLETKNLFEAYRHVLKKLQNFNEKTLPFRDYFAFAENVIETPVFMTRNDVSKILSLEKSYENMDESQSRAFSNSLRSNISLIQGPPGTGKTYVGLQIIKYLSENFQTRNRNVGPILVVCYTNHALDQFLSDIISILGQEHVLRVGGRSKLQIMKACNINSAMGKWRMKKLFPHKLYKQCVVAREQLENIEYILVEQYIKITNLNGKLLSLNDFWQYMNNRDRRYFNRVDFDNWLKGSEVILEESTLNIHHTKESVVSDVLKELIDETISCLLTKEAKEIFDQILNDLRKENIEIEDNEAFLYNQRLLEEDMDWDESMQKFKAVYSKNIRGTINHSKLSEEYSSEFKTVANSKLIKRKIKQVKALDEETYQRLDNLDVEFNVRLQLYKYWWEKYRCDLIDSYKSQKSQYNKLSEYRKELNDQQYEMVMKSVKVIGMTTTGAARYGSVLNRVGCKVVVIEEAAEVLEAHVICSLSKDCQQLIMIGDHKQLRPKVDVYQLEVDYNLAISLFERLISNKCPYDTLQYQHRMRPEISKCVLPIYPDLKDSDNVFRYSEVTGMKTNLYFFHHNNPEEESADKSYKNKYEAQFISEFCQYLIRCGNSASQITVLTFYSGQLYCLHKVMKGQMFMGIRICVIDNFQGEENDIIILSLVRSNRKKIVGFLKCPNRICVALSRAKRGFYVVGNITMVSQQIKLIQDVLSNSVSKENVGFKMPLRCSLHPEDDNYFVTTIDDLRKPCPSICGMQMKCGHQCPLPCHTLTPSHKKFKCTKPCEKLCARNLHECKFACWKPCSCTEEISVTLKCGHETIISCQVKESSVKCQYPCNKSLKCGHMCQERCYSNCICSTKVVFKLPCGHDSEDICGSDVNKMKCKEMVVFDLPCDHSVQAVCGSKISDIKCLNLVSKTYVCGHTSTCLCWNISEKCMKKISVKLKCNHTENVLCGSENEVIECTQKCNVKLDCSHLCQYKCSDCLNGRLHQRCLAKCARKLKCDHNCPSKCHSGHCPPCQQPCLLTCSHETCKLTCSEICTRKPCVIKCTKRVFCRNCRQLKSYQTICERDSATLCDVCSTDGCQNTNVLKMRPCNCKIRLDKYQPKLVILKDGLELHCQNCNKKLSLPYRKWPLRLYNVYCSKVLLSLSDDQMTKWTELFDKIEAMCIVDKETVVEILTEIQEVKIFNCKDDKFDVSCTFYEELLEMISNVNLTSENSNLETYNGVVKNSIKFLIKWLNPTIRQFNQKEIICYQKEKDLITLMIEVIQFLQSTSQNEYALIFQEAFSLLEELRNFFGIIDFQYFGTKLQNMKMKINRDKSATKAEEEIVDKINECKDIIKAFQLSHLSTAEQLKQVKNMIKKCHPDKNRASAAAAAFRKLNFLKNTLKSTLEP